MKLFANITKKKKNATFAKQKRWKDQKKVHKVPFYSKISEWGMKTNYEKKDILYKLSKSQANNSIYYQ